MNNWLELGGGWRPTSSQHREACPPPSLLLMPLPSQPFDKTPVASDLRVDPLAQSLSQKTPIHPLPSQVTVALLGAAPLATWVPEPPSHPSIAMGTPLQPRALHPPPCPLPQPEPRGTGHLARQRVEGRALAPLGKWSDPDVLGELSGARRLHPRAEQVFPRPGAWGPQSLAVGTGGSQRPHREAAVLVHS